MSDIFQRTVFYETRDGKIRFQDWALVQTTLGQMAEMFNVNTRVAVGTQVPTFDYTDASNRIDEMKEIDADKLMLLISGGASQIHGGNLLPRVGR